MIKLDKQISMYSAGDGFLVLVIENDSLNGYPCHTAMLGHEGYGIWDHMFGVSNEIPMKEFMEMIEENLPQQVQMFKNDHPDCLNGLSMD